jgi:hypothetical protein
MLNFGRGAQDHASCLGYMTRFLALLGVVVQLLTPAVALRPPPSHPDQGNFAALFDAGLICHNPGKDQQPKPGQPTAPAPHHRDHAVCCPWHGYTNPLFPAPTTAEPVGFLWIDVAFAAPVVFFGASRPQDAARARGPPDSGLRPF